MSARVIQTFIRVCNDCPHCVYYSGGVFHCSLTQERMTPEQKLNAVAARCPLPFAGPPREPATQQEAK